VPPSIRRGCSASLGRGTRAGRARSRSAGCRAGRAGGRPAEGRPGPGSSPARTRPRAPGRPGCASWSWTTARPCVGS
jgi:hypothetical protein